MLMDTEHFEDMIFEACDINWLSRCNTRHGPYIMMDAGADKGKVCIEFKFVRFVKGPVPRCS